MIASVAAKTCSFHPKCCKQCGKTAANSKACGNACISNKKTCHKQQGCACDCVPSGKPKCNPDVGFLLSCDVFDLLKLTLLFFSFFFLQKSYPCGNSCITWERECTKEHGTAIFDPDYDWDNFDWGTEHYTNSYYTDM